MEKAKKKRYKLISSTWNELLHLKPVSKCHKDDNLAILDSLDCICLLSTSYVLQYFIIDPNWNAVYRLCMASCLSSWWHYAGLKEEEKCCQAQRWNRWFLGEVELYVARPLGVHFDRLQRAVSGFDKSDGDASAGRSLLLWNCLTDGLHPVTVCYFAWKSALRSF